jgi:hypothetical protein
VDRGTIVFWALLVALLGASTYFFAAHQLAASARASAR